jgi:hypothetical protein
MGSSVGGGLKKRSDHHDDHTNANAPSSSKLFAKEGGEQGSEESTD